MTQNATLSGGANELPIRHLLTLCAYYCVSADYILGRTDNPKTNK